MKNAHMLLLALLPLVINPPHSHGRPAGDSPSDSVIQRRVETLDREIRSMQEQMELLRNGQSRKEQPPLIGAGRDGFFLRSADGDFLLKLRALMQADSRFFLHTADETPVDGFLIRRMRFLLEGTVARSFDFRFMPDFAGGVLVLQDAYADIRFLPELKARVGKFKAPVGLERLQSPQNTLFIDRAFPTLIVPNRDVGIQVHGDIFGRTMAYAVGVFNGVPDGRSSDFDLNDGKDFAARLFLRPFAEGGSGLLEGLGFGCSGSAGSEHGTISSPSLSSYVSPGAVVVFRYRNDGETSGTALADGERVRLSPQMYYACGPFSLLGEYAVSSQEVALDATRRRLTTSALQASASVVLTGEDASYRGVTPEKPFDPSEGNWGAVEFALRYHVLDTDDDAFPVFADPAVSVTKETAVTTGINWYMNSNIRLSVNYEQARFSGGAPAGDRRNENTFLSRVSVGF